MQKRTWQWTNIANTDSQETSDLLSEMAPQQRQDSNFQTELISGRKSYNGLDTKTYWLTVNRNVTFTLTWLGRNKYRNLAVQVGGVLKNMLMSPVRFRPEKGFAGDAQQKQKTIDSTYRQRGHPTSTNP
jgi:hypothetical protein